MSAKKIPEHDSPSSLLLRTRALLNERNDFLDVYKHTGINPSWLWRFATGRIRNPSVNRVQNLYEHLTATKLDV